MLRALLAMGWGLGTALAASSLPLLLLGAATAGAQAARTADLVRTGEEYTLADGRVGFFSLEEIMLLENEKWLRASGLSRDEIVE